MKVPDVLLSGNHAKIEEWRRKESLRRTYMRRADLLEGREWSKQEQQWLREFEEDK
jgi:tRNA (guanine37-N1)-methyltransferase